MGIKVNRPSFDRSGGEGSSLLWPTHPSKFGWGSITWPLVQVARHVFSILLQAVESGSLPHIFWRKPLFDSNNFMYLSQVNS